MLLSASILKLYLTILSEFSNGFWETMSWSDLTSLRRTVSTTQFSQVAWWAKIQWSERCTARPSRISWLNVLTPTLRFLSHFSGWFMAILKNVTKLLSPLSISNCIRSFFKFWNYIKSCYRSWISTGLFWPKAWFLFSWVTNAQKLAWTHLPIKLPRVILEFSRKCSTKIPYHIWFLWSNSSSKILFSLSQDKISWKTARAEKKAMSFFMRYVV